MPKCTCPPAADSYQPGSLPEVFQLIEGLEKKLHHIQSQTLRLANLTTPQFVVLRLLREKDERPLKDVADELHCSRATVTGIVDTMEKKELVRRLPNGDDRRSVLVRLTEKGLALMNRAEPLIGHSFSNCCDILDADETLALSQLLKKLNQNLNF